MVEDKVEFGWVEKYYYGRLISFHISGKFLAYVLKRKFLTSCNYA